MERLLVGMHERAPRSSATTRPSPPELSGSRRTMFARSASSEPRSQAGLELVTISDPVIGTVSQAGLDALAHTGIRAGAR